MTHRDINVLIISGGTTGSNDFRQLPNNISIIESKELTYHFFFNHIDTDPDIVVVRNKYIKKKQTFNVAKQNTILMLSEPLSVVQFPQSYCNQFGMLYSCQSQLMHHNVVYGPALIPWFVGTSDPTHYSYNYFKQSPLPKKSKLISVITSNKAFTRGHQNRLDFVMKLKQHFGDRIDIYGRGFNSFNDKWDVLKDYKYHIAIENTSDNYYWTEKLSDCYLSGCFPIYYGCKNINDYFPDESLTAIDITKPDAAIATIEHILKTDNYEQRVPYIEQAKNLVLDKYNMFSIIANCCNKLDTTIPRTTTTLRPAITALNAHNLYSYIIERNILSIRNFFMKIMGLRNL